MTVALMLPALALAADAIVRHWPKLFILVCVVLLIGVPGNVRLLHDYRSASALAAYRRYILAAPRLPLARRLPRSVTTDVGIVPGPSIGWLLDSLPSGRIPSPGPLSRDQIATETLQLALGPVSQPVTAPCRNLKGPTAYDLQDGDRITIARGAVDAVLRPVEGGESQPLRITGSRVALAAPLPLVLTPSRAGPARVCIARA